MEPKSIVRALMPAMWLLLLVLPLAAVPARSSSAQQNFQRPAATLADGPCWTCGRPSVR